MEKIELTVSKREEAGKELKKSRHAGLIPAVVYGKKIKPISILVDHKAFVKNILRSEAGMNAIVTLKVAGEKQKDLAVLTHDVQRHPLTGDILHVDFRHIVMDEAIKTKVRVELAGTPIGVKESGGVLVHGLREVEVECLPTDIPDNFTVDVSGLKINDSLHVTDLVKLPKVKVLTNLTEMVATCSPPTKEEEVAAPIPTPEEVAAAGEAGKAVAEEQVKEKAAPGAAPAKEKAASGAAPAKDKAETPKAEKK
jgi:large subunit ribosomal protein L25